MPLKLSLKPNEAVIVNGAVLRNGERRSSLLIENQVRILRQKDVLFPEKMEHYSEKLYFCVMQMYLTGSVDGRPFECARSALTSALTKTQTEAEDLALLEIARACTAREVYKALSLCRRLMKQINALEE